MKFFHLNSIASRHYRQGVYTALFFTLWFLAMAWWLYPHAVLLEQRVLIACLLGTPLLFIWLAIRNLKNIQHCEQHWQKKHDEAEELRSLLEQARKRATL